MVYIRTPAVSLVTELARALHSAGLPAHRLEAALAAVCVPLGVEGRFFATPTALLVQVDEQVELLRLAPADVHLARQVALDRVASKVAAGQLDASVALGQLRRALNGPSPWGRMASVGSFSLSSGSVAALLGGGATDVVGAALLGLAVGLLSLLAMASRRVAHLFPMVAAALVAAGAQGLGALAPLAPELAVIAGLIVLLPGFSFTMALAELATGNLAAGTARAMGAGMALLLLAIGTAVGLGLTSGLETQPLGAPLPAWCGVASILTCAVALGVLFQAEARHLPAIVAVCFVAILGTRYATSFAGEQLGPFLGALAVGLFSNLRARLRREPAAVTLLPGLLMLVPGSLGYRAVTALAERHVVDGVDIAFQALLVGAALVCGLLVANVVVPTRRAV